VADADQTVRRLLAQSHEGVERLREYLAALEREPEPESAALLASSSSHLRFLRDTSASLGCGALAELTRHGHELLTRLQTGGGAVGDPARHVLLELVDVLSTTLAQLETTGVEGSPDHSPLVCSLQELSQPCTSASAPFSRRDRERDIAVVIPSPAGVTGGGAAPPIGRLLVERRATRPDDVTLAVLQQGEGDARPLGEILVEHGAATATQVVDALETQAEKKRSTADRRIRVDVALLDGLMRLVAELGDTRDGILRRAAVLEDEELSELAQRLDHLADQLYAGATRTRG
jgi:two-component system chemotaxis sensor kinase CheA